VTKAPGQAPAVAAFSAFTAVVTFLPEAMDFFWERRGRDRALKQKKSIKQDGVGGGGGGGDKMRVVDLRIALGNVGCSACAAAVRAALEKSPLVASVVAVDVTTATAVVELARWRLADDN
jgi:hypothetical protein